MSQGNIMFNDIFTAEQTEEEAEEAEVEAVVEAVEAEAVVEAVEAVEAVEEAEETEETEEAEEASEIDDDNEELWSGEANRNTEANSEVINPEMSIIAALFGFEPASEIQQTLSRIRRREDSSHPPPRKIFRNNAGKRIASEYMSTYK